VRALDRARSLAPDSVRAYRERCVFLERTRGAGALAACNEAIGRVPDDAELFAARASVRSAAGQHEEALVDASRAIELRPDAPRFLYERQAVRRRAGDDGGAFRDLSAACAMHHERSCRELEARGVRAP
jgi:Flp pilus assembly protein TadD